MDIETKEEKGEYKATVLFQIHKENGKETIELTQQIKTLNQYLDILILYAYISRVFV